MGKLDNILFRFLFHQYYNTLMYESFICLLVGFFLVLEYFSVGDMH